MKVEAILFLAEIKAIKDKFPQYGDCLRYEDIKKCLEVKGADKLKNKPRGPKL